MELRKRIALKTRLLFRIFTEYIRENPCSKDDQLRYQIRMRIDRLEIASAHPDELHEVTYFIIETNYFVEMPFQILLRTICCTTSTIGPQNSCQLNYPQSFATRQLS